MGSLYFRFRLDPFDGSPPDTVPHDGAVVTVVRWADDVGEMIGVVHRGQAYDVWPYELTPCTKDGDTEGVPHG